MKRLIGFAVLLASLSTQMPAAAGPRSGEQFPDLIARDATGRTVELATLTQGRRTLLVAITDRHADEQLRAWFDAADARTSPDVNRVSIVSIKLPGFVSDGYMRAKARQQIPPQYWHDSLIDRNQDMAAALGLPRDRLPTAFVIDENGRVVAEVHGTVGAADSNVIWHALAQSS